MLRNQKGFTLMELMIVIVIIGVLAAIGVPAYNSYVAKAKKTVCFTNLRVLNTAVEMHKMEKGAAPADIDALAAYMDVDDYDSLECPTGGEYSLTAAGVPTCSKHGGYDGTPPPTEP